MGRAIEALKLLKIMMVELVWTNRFNRYLILKIYQKLKLQEIYNHSSKIKVILPLVTEALGKWINLYSHLMMLIVTDKKNPLELLKKKICFNKEMTKRKK